MQYVCTNQFALLKVVCYYNLMRKFSTGATRDSNKGKLEFARFLCPNVIKSFGKYMDKNRIQSDGKLRDPDNWKKGMDKQSYMDSMWRHLHDVWLNHEGFDAREDKITALNGLLFNVMGYLHEELKNERKKISKK